MIRRQRWHPGSGGAKVESMAHRWLGGILMGGYLATSLIACSSPPPEPRTVGESCELTSECASNLCYVSTCLEPERDDDGDGLTNTLESQLGTDPFAFDSDGDGRVSDSEFVMAVSESLPYDQVSIMDPEPPMLWYICD